MPIGTTHGFYVYIQLYNVCIIYMYNQSCAVVGYQSGQDEAILPAQDTGFILQGNLDDHVFVFYPI